MNGPRGCRCQVTGDEGNGFCFPGRPAATASCRTTLLPAHLPGAWPAALRWLLLTGSPALPTAPLRHATTPKCSLALTVQLFVVLKWCVANVTGPHAPSHVPLIMALLRSMLSAFALVACPAVPCPAVPLQRSYSVASLTPPSLQHANQQHDVLWSCALAPAGAAADAPPVPVAGAS